MKCSTLKKTTAGLALIGLTTLAFKGLKAWFNAQESVGPLSPEDDIENVAYIEETEEAGHQPFSQKMPMPMPMKMPTFKPYKPIKTSPGYAGFAGVYHAWQAGEGFSLRNLYTKEHQAEMRKMREAASAKTVPAAEAGASKPKTEMLGWLFHSKGAISSRQPHTVREFGELRKKYDLDLKKRYGFGKV